jgi:hypothetical protein
METLISVLNFEQQAEGGAEINSPRTLEACLRAGYDPTELLPRPRKAFKEKGLSEEMVNIKFNSFERKRQGNSLFSTYISNNMTYDMFEMN